MPEDLPTSPDLPLEPPAEAPRNVVEVSFTNHAAPAPVTMRRRQPGDCRHTQIEIDDALEKAFCADCRAEVPLFKVVKMIVAQDAQREQRIAYEEKLVRDRREYERAVRRKAALGRLEQRRRQDSAKMEAAFNPGVSEDKARDFFQGVRRTLEKQGEAADSSRRIPTESPSRQGTCF